MTVVEVLHQPNYKSRRVKLRGLDPEKTYKVSVFDMKTADDSEENVLTLKGDSLMYAGINTTDGFWEILSQGCSISRRSEQTVRGRELEFLDNGM